MTIVALLVALLASSKANNDVEQAQALAGRLSTALAQKVDFKTIEAIDGKDVFTLESQGKKVLIGGNNANAMAVGLPRYLHRYCKVTVSWYADVPVLLPKTLPDVPVPEQVTARVPQRFFLT